MAVVQTNFNAAIPYGYPGMVANAETSNRITRACQDSAGIAFGAAAFQSSSVDHGCTATPGTKFRGVAIADAGVIPISASSTPDTYPQYASVGLMNEGVIWVTAGSNTTPGAPVYVTSGGVFTATSTSNTAIPATFEDTVTSGSICRIRVVAA